MLALTESPLFFHLMGKSARAEFIAASTTKETFPRTGPALASRNIGNGEWVRLNLVPIYLPNRSVIVPRHTMNLANPLIFGCRFDDRSTRHLSDAVAMHLLPRRLAFGIGVSTLRFQFATAPVQLRIVDEDVRFPTPEIDANAVAAAQQSKAATRCRFRRRVENRW